MVNTTELEKRINSAGYKRKYIAAELGISHQALLNKIQGKTEFLASEIYSLSELLKLNNRDRDAIFFYH